MLLCLNPRAKRALKNQSDIPKSLDEVVELCIRSDSDTDFLKIHNRVVFTEGKSFSSRDSSWAGQPQQVAAFVKEFHLKFRDKVHRPSSYKLARVKMFLPLCLPLKRDIVL